MLMNYYVIIVGRCSHSIEFQEFRICRSIERRKKNPKKSYIFFFLPENARSPGWHSNRDVNLHGHMGWPTLLCTMHGVRRIRDHFISLKRHTHIIFGHCVERIGLREHHPYRSPSELIIIYEFIFRLKIKRNFSQNIPLEQLVHFKRRLL